MHIEETVEVPAPIERVWDVTVDLARWPAWNSTVEAAALLDAPPVRPGLRARLTQPGNRPALWTVTRVEPPRWFVWETRPLGMHVVAAHELQPTDAGTRVRLAIDVSGPTAPLLGWIVIRVSRKFLPMEAASLVAECTRA